MTTITYIVTSHLTLRFLRGQVAALSKQGFIVSLISSSGNTVAEFEGIADKHIAIEMRREISPLQDFKSLLILVFNIFRLNPQIVNGSTPKAGLLGMVAAWVARVPVRIYLVRGLRLETTSGFQRKVLLFTEKIAATCANYVVCNSQSLREIYVENALCTADKITIIGHGSSNGVDPDRFSPTPTKLEHTAELQHSLSIPTNAPVIGFVGRLTRDKGIIELMDAFELVQESIPDVYLLLVGTFEVGDPLPLEVVHKIKADQHIIQVDWVEDTSAYYYLMNVLAFPSYREGFPNVPLEAALAGIPTVGFATTGVVDAVIDGITGLLISAGSTDELANALLRMLQDTDLCHAIGDAARQRALRDFNPAVLWSQWADFYQKCLKEKL